jgi:hypothetical protein
MTSKTRRNAADNEGGQMAESILPDLSLEDETSDPGGKSRREALAILAKHTAYTAPALLATLLLSKKRAAAYNF